MIRYFLLILAVFFTIKISAQVSSDTIPSKRILLLPKQDISANYLNSIDFSRIADSTLRYTEIKAVINENPQTTAPEKPVFLIDSTYAAAVLYLNQYYSANQKTQQDSSIIQSLNLLSQLTTYSRLRQQLDSIKHLIDNIKIDYEIAALHQHLDTLQKKKSEYNLIRENKYNIDSVINLNDSIGLSSMDTNFIDQISLMLDQKQSTDTIKQSIQVDSLIHQNFIPDSLLSSLEYFINEIEKDSIINWLSELQNDTLQFNIIDVNRDSVQLKMYKNSPEIVNIEITDVWGKKHPAIIRDIHQKSFRIIIDESAELNKVSVDESKKTFEQYSITNNAGIVTLSKRTVPKHFKPWSFYGNTNFNISQIAFHQWTLGGESSVSLLWGTELWWKYRRDRHQWNNHFKIKVGFIRQGAYTDNSAIFKSNEDRLEYLTRYNYKIAPKTYGAFMVNFKTRTLPSYDYPTDTTKIIKSRFFSPAYLTFSLGTEYRLNKQNIFYASPLALRSTMVLDPDVDETNYGLTEGENVRHELGFNIIANTKFKVFDDIVLKNNIELFSNYLNNPQNIDIRWDLEISMPVNNYIVSKISASFIYDDDVTVTKRRSDGTTYESKGGQFKERISVGLEIKF